eukprot:12612512-Alexandrium_andersonii.AAC.1
MCEFSRGEHQPVLWCRASIPEDPFKDVKLMAGEECHKDSKNPQQLIDLLDAARPLDKGRFMCQAYGRD